MESKNIFISHIHEDDKTLQGLKDLLNKNGYGIKDSSIDSSKPNDAKSAEYIKSSILAPRINWAGAFVVLISADTHQSKWVNWEIEYAQKLGKRIIGVWDQGAQDSDLPNALEKYADAIVGWQADRVMDAITGKINNWYTAEGVERSQQVIERYTC